MKKDITHCLDGVALAAIVSAGLGCAMIGLATVLAEANTTVKEMLNWWPPAGPLTGKTGIGVIVWLFSWLVLHLKWRNREFSSFERVWRFGLLLILIGFLGTFPPIFDLFAGH